VSCPAKVASAVAALPWVEFESIKADRTSRQVRFTLKDRKQFDIEKVKEVIAEAGYPDASLLAGPTDQ
jgi:copper chaperone CopZ